MMTEFTGIIIIALLAWLSGLVLSTTLEYCKAQNNSLVEQIDNLLPQTQCCQCGYLGCRPYAVAITKGEVINKCIPGAFETSMRIAKLLNIPQTNLSYTSQEQATKPFSRLAIIDGSSCIGCTKCIKICPVDAIIGTTKALHTVLSEYCTGCELCINSCPTKCITMLPVVESIALNKISKI